MQPIMKMDINPSRNLLDFSWVKVKGQGQMIENCTNWHEIFRKDARWSKIDPVKFWVNLGQGQGQRSRSNNGKLHQLA